MHLAYIEFDKHWWRAYWVPGTVAGDAELGRKPFLSHPVILMEGRSADRLLWQHKLCWREFHSHDVGWRSAHQKNGISAGPSRAWWYKCLLDSFLKNGPKKKKITFSSQAGWFHPCVTDLVWSSFLFFMAEWSGLAENQCRVSAQQMSWRELLSKVMLGFWNAVACLLR